VLKYSLWARFLGTILTKQRIDLRQV